MFHLFIKFIEIFNCLLILYKFVIKLNETDEKYNYFWFFDICLSIDLMPASKPSKISRNRVFDRKNRRTVQLVETFTMMSTGLVPITCDSLRQLLDHVLQNEDKPSNVLILDCRPFLIHNDSHIVNSVNIHCPAIIRYVSQSLLNNYFII